MKIGIFGGTFNPIHNGHIKITEDIKNELNLDAIYFVPSYLTPDKQFHVENISSKDRYEMVKRAVKAEDKTWLKVSNFEFKQKEVSYTYKTIRHFKEKFPTADLYWIMGEDRYSGFNKWENVSDIRENAKIIIYRRSKNINERILKDKSVIYLKDKFYDISSTNILSKLQWEHIPTAAKKYISKNKLYLKTVVFKVLADKRYQHSVAVSSHAKRLAKEYKYKDVRKAELTGLVHDLFKLFDYEFQLDYYNKYTNEVVLHPIPLGVLHGFDVAYWLKYEYLWDDKEMYDALCRHTLTHPEATKLDKIIYVADKIATDRKGERVGKLRKLAYNDLDLTYRKLVKEQVLYLKSKNLEPHHDTWMAYKKFVDPKKGEIKNEFNLKKNRRKVSK